MSRLFGLLASSQAPTESITCKDDLQHYIAKLIADALVSEKDTKILDNVLNNDRRSNISDAAIDEVVASFSTKLALEDEIEVSLNALQQLMRRNTTSVKKFASSDNGTALIQNLLKIQDLGDEDASILATELLSSLDADNSSGAPQGSEDHVKKVLNKALYEACPDSLGVDTLAQLALRRIDVSPSPATFESLLPDVSRWAEALDPFLSAPPPGSFAITDDLGGTVSLVVSAQKSK